MAMVLLAPLLMLGPCTEEPSVVMQSNNDNTVTTSFTPPDLLHQLRAIDDLGELRFIIRINQRDYVVDLEQGATSGSLNIVIPVGQDLDIVVIWSELYKDIWLPLAKAEVETTVPVDAEDQWEFTIDTNSYWTGYDYDSDRYSNLEERNEGTDPLVKDDRDQDIVDVPIKFIANLPDRLRNVDDNIDESLSAVATINGLRIPLNREEDAWLGQTTEPTNSTLRVIYTFNSSIRPRARLATWEAESNAGETGITIEASPNDYNYNYDNDSDGVDNLQEIIQGTNPDDKNESNPDACANSNFDIGCDKDTDGDGTPDSVETEDSDKDDDSIPDYLESTNVDADEEGLPLVYVNRQPINLDTLPDNHTTITMVDLITCRTLVC